MGLAMRSINEVLARTSGSVPFSAARSRRGVRVSGARVIARFLSPWPLYLTQRGDLTRAPMQHLMDGRGQFAVHRRGMGDLLDTGILQRGDAAEETKQGAATDLADTGDRVENAHRGILAAQCTVIGHGVAMHLVPHALQQKQGLRIAREDNRVGLPRLVDQLELLGEADHVQLQPEFGGNGDGDGERALAAVNLH